MSADQATSSPPPRVIFAFLQLYLPLAVLVLLVASLVYLTQKSTRIEAIKGQQVNLVRLEREVLETDLLTHVSDAVFLARLTTLAMDRPDGQVPLKDILEAAFLYFSQSQKVYDQVRFLDTSGREVVRINLDKGKSWVVDERALQPKGHRYYVSAGLKMAPGQVYISPFDLNVEGGRLEVPYKPTIRFVSPVEDPDDGLLGVVVLNFLGDRILDRLRRASRAGQNELFLVNQGGWWLVGPDPKHEWGHSINERTPFSMATAYQQAWRNIAPQENGQVVTPYGLFTYQSVALMDKVQSVGASQPPTRVDDHWWIISRVPPEVLALPWLPAMFWICAGVMLLMAGVVWLWALARVRRAVAEGETLRNQRRLEFITNTSQDAITLVDSQDRVQFWNLAAERLFGYSRQEAMGRDLHHLVASSEQIPAVVKGLEVFGQTGQGPIFEGRREVLARRKDGSHFPAEVSASAFSMDGHWYAAGSVRDITEHKQSEEALKRLANTDGLTGVLNRRRFMELSRQEVARSHRYGGPLSLIMLDVDHFKAVNDSYGHEVGDEVLVSLSQVCRQVLRQVDLFGRVGGEEFMALLPETGLEAAAMVAERLRIALAAHAVSASKQELRVTISLGVAQLSPETRLSDLMRLADDAMYRAKQNGRNRVEISDQK
ncbi:MAG: diguanylate cyclase [Proteobacteria bacterium]|nr:diguanylate cyclase [Pseudomonadota bacterium]MBU4576437.1 diguanylate cyclase [Pseudomonadota bacterium]MBU4599090.1 diguanylate cyclase [Pseudomonadota bacterium]MBV1714857.1 diguanylate cyclase [Desulfarculus sp.]MBV1753137.1 diguanylate cyclase [Desulfarculus sp.]